MRRVATVIVLALAAVGMAGPALAQIQAARMGPGTYRGNVRCTGADRFSDGARTRLYHSRPAVSAVFAANRRLRRWTYLFLGRHNTVIQSRAVRAGERFTYAAGAHIERPGRTRVTILAAVRARRRVEVLARLDWSSPSTHYIGSGIYDLTLQRTGPATIKYDAIKVVIKLPQAGPSAGNPVVRRNEHCSGSLIRTS